MPEKLKQLTPEDASALTHIFQFRNVTSRNPAKYIGLVKDREAKKLARAIWLTQDIDSDALEFVLGMRKWEQGNTNAVQERRARNRRKSTSANRLPHPR